MPNVSPAPGETIEEVKRTRVLNKTDVDQENFPKDSLEYMDTLTSEQWAKGEHTVYLYRMEPPLFRGAGPAYVTKFATPINLELIQKDFGGGVWRIVVKRGDSRITDRMYTISGVPKDLSTAGAMAGTSSNGHSVVSADSNTSKLIDAATNVDAQKAQVDMVKSTATELVQMAKEAAPKQMSIQEIIMLAKELQPKAPAGNPVDWWSNPLVIALATKLIERLFANPFEQIAPIVEMVSKINGGAANVAGDWKLAAAQAVPKVAESLADALHEMRMGAEVQAAARTAGSEVVMRGGQAPNANTQPNPAPPPPAAGNSKVIEMQPPQGDPMEAFETKFVELLANPEINGAQAAEILAKDWPNILAEIARYPTEVIIANAFKRPILAPQAANPRVPQFVAELIAWVKAQPKVS